MSLENLSKQLAFIKEIDKLKYIQRKTRLFNSDRNENDAEHSWHLAVMALVLVEHSNEKIDLLRVLKMVLIHDIVEIDAGDTFLYDAKRDAGNEEAEREAARRIFGMLPKEQAEELIAIWEEFEEGKPKKLNLLIPLTGSNQCCKTIPTREVPGPSIMCLVKK
ncbi:metal dependent phosphohydrolase [Fulvivirga imtechensis AK7]|uniref:Metal dependent phosphohydrolase n=1 Tax=Fulvivirga imtechensis AK7 TaxID=1237149 RepID=L8JQV2_9BACT|nr:metal dependent phosphohydrolase [Fulvivirga imtechensis AK7]